MMTFELVNPSDHILLESDCVKVASIAAMVTGDGFYGLKNDKGDLVFPMLAFGGSDNWIKDNFGTENDYHEFTANNKEKIGRVLLSFKYVNSRSSVKCIVDHAHTQGRSILKSLGISA